MPFDGRPQHPRENELLDALGALERAREIVRKRWTKCWWNSGDAYCAASALVLAIHGENYEYRRSSTALEDQYSIMRGVHPAFIALQDFVGTQRLEGRNTPYGSIISWNDSQRSVDTIIAGFDAAIANLRHELVSGPAERIIQKSGSDHPSQSVTTSVAS